MLRLLKLALAALLVLLLLATGLAAHTWYAKPLRLEWFYGRIFASFALQRPELLSTMGLLPPWANFHADELDDASPAGQERTERLVADGLATLRRYPREGLDAEGRRSYDTLEWYLASQVEGHAFRHHDFPVNQLFGVQADLPNFMMQVHPVATRADAEAYVARLRKFPIKFAQLIESLALREAKGVIPPQFTVQKVLVQMNGFIAPAPGDHALVSSFADRLARLPAGQVDMATRVRLRAEAAAAVEHQVYPAYRQLIAHFNRLQARATVNHGAWHLPDGERYYAWCIRRHTSTEMTANELHELGLAEVARIAAAMDGILRQQGLGEGSVGARVQQLAARPEQQFPNTAAGREAMLAQYRSILREAQQKLGQAFARLPRMALEVQPVPEFAQATAPAAYYRFGAFDGSRPGVFFANLRNTAETPRFAMRTLAHHEGVPGHHLQIALAQELTGLPFFRRIVPFTAYAEGWALYAEQLAFELGLLPEALDNLGRLRDEQMRAVRLVVDTGIHAKRWSREKAIAYMLEHTGMAGTDVVAEIERYFVDPGQALAYKAGMLKILALREKARAALGPRFDLKLFHDEVLGHGALPLVLLERSIDDWITRQKAG